MALPGFSTIIFCMSSKIFSLFSENFNKIFKLLTSKSLASDNETILLAENFNGYEISSSLFNGFPIIKIWLSSNNKFSYLLNALLNTKISVFPTIPSNSIIAHCLLRLSNLLLILVTMPPILFCSGKWFGRLTRLILFN